MKKIFIIYILFVGLCYGEGFVNDSQVVGVVTQGENSIGSNRVCIYVSTPILDTPSCNTGQRFCANVDTSIGKSHFSSALAAYTSKSKVSIRGMGSCNSVSNSEDINFIFLK